MPKYATLNELKSQVQIDDATDDALLTVALEAAEQQIDEFCRRTFDEVDTQDASATTTRVYTPETPLRLSIDDAAAVDDVEERGSVTSSYSSVSSDDWALWPSNADADGKPYTNIVSPRGRSFQSGFEAIRVTAWFGWPSTPDTVKQATLLQASRLAQRRNAQFGIANVVGLDGTTGMRLLAKLDADVELLLNPFRRDPVLI